MSAGGGGLGQRSAVSALRGSGPPPALVAPLLPPTGGGARPSVALYRGGGVGWGSGSAGGGGRPTALSPSHPLAPIAWADGARPSLVSPLLWGPGLRRWRVPPAVVPVGEGVAQSPGQPVVGVRICDAEHRPPLQESRPRWLSVGPRRPNHPPEVPLVVLWGRPAPPLGVPPGSPRPSGGAQHRRAGSSSPWWSPSRPSSATRSPPPPEGGPQPPGGPGPCLSPGPRAGPPLLLARAPLAAPVPSAPAPRPAPPPPR